MATDYRGLPGYIDKEPEDGDRNLIKTADHQPKSVPINYLGWGWTIDPTTGNLYSAGNDVNGIGQLVVADPAEVSGAHYVALTSATGVMRGVIIGSADEKGGELVIGGMKADGLATETFNGPLRLAGSIVCVNSQFALQLQPSGEAEEHVLKIGAVATGDDGNRYGFITLGPKIIASVEWQNEDPADYALPQDTWVTGIANGTVDVNFTATTDLSFYVYVANDGDRSCAFRAQARVNKGAGWVDIGAPTAPIILTNDWSLIQGSEVLSGADIPQSGWQYELQVQTSNWEHGTRPDPWVRGSIEPTTIRLAQGS